MLVESLYCKGVFDMYYIQSHSQQRHHGGLGILIPSFLVLSFHSFQKQWSCRNSSLISYNLFTHIDLFCRCLARIFCSQINLHQATMTAITVMPGSITAYTVNSWNNTQASGPRKNEKYSLADGSSCPTSNTTSSPEHHNGGKCDPTTPNTNGDNPPGHQRQKKPCRRVKVDTAAKEKKDLGMFYLRNSSINPLEFFPKNLPKKLCANFTCKGKECNNTNCVFAHPKKALELKRKTSIVIANHFIKKNTGWFNKYHFMRMPNITDGVKKLLRNTKGPTSKMAWLVWFLYCNMTNSLDHKNFAWLYPHVPD